MYIFTKARKEGIFRIPPIKPVCAYEGSTVQLIEYAWLQWKPPKWVSSHNFCLAFKGDTATVTSLPEVPTPTYQKHEGQLRTIFISFFPLPLQPSKRWDINRDLQAGRLAKSKTEHTHCKLAVPPRETQRLPPLWQLKLAALSLSILSDTDYYPFEVHLRKSDVHNKAWYANPCPHKHTLSIWKKK